MIAQVSGLSTRAGKGRGACATTPDEVDEISERAGDNRPLLDNEAVGGARPQTYSKGGDALGRA